MDIDQKRILIVDDESGFTRLLKLTLEKTGKFAVLEVNEGEKAHSAAREFRPHIVFLDIVMPKIDGGDVAAKLQGDPTTKDIPIVFLTAIVSNKEASNNGLMGGFPFLSKPISVDALVECIEKHTPSRG